MIAITDAAFIGFRIARERPMVLVYWAAFYLLFTVATVVILIGMAGPALMALQTMDQANPDPTEALALFGKVAPAFLVLLPLAFLYYGVMYAAVSRAVLDPADDRMGYLRFGQQELRQALLMFLLMLLFFVAYLALLIVGAIFVGLTAMGGEALAGFGVALMFLVVFSGMIFLLVKFSLASPQTYAEGKLNLFGSWRLSKGRFWPMLGAYLLASILTIIVYLLTAGIFYAVVAVVGGMEMAGKIMTPDMSSYATFLTPLSITYYVVTAIVTAMTTLIWVGPTAEIYRQITSGGEARV